MMGNPRKLLIVDDSGVMRAVIAKMFTDNAGIQVVAEATNGVEALEAVRQYDPDVIALDVVMPMMDGITTLKHIMIKYPRPTVMLSSLTLEGTRMAFEAMRYGAVDFISKPSSLNPADLREQEAAIRGKIEYAAAVEVEPIKYIRNGTGAAASVAAAGDETCHSVVAMGAAEGGYGALLKIIPHLRADLPVSYLVTMYAAPEYVEAFAGYLNDSSAVQVKRAAHYETIRPGVCYLSSGADYMSVHRQNDAYTLHVNAAPFASRKGAVDMLLFSSADVFGADCVGVILSGSGDDGAEGLEEILRMGGTAIVQDPKTCLCKDMAQAALNRSRSDYVISDALVAATLAEVLDKGGEKSD